MKSIFPTDGDSMQAFHAVLAESREEASAAVLEVFSSLPAFEQVMSAVPESARLEEEQRSRALQDAALLSGDWEPYLENLRTQGIRFAAMGIRFGDWFRLSTAFRGPLLSRMVLTLADDPARMQQAIFGMGSFLDVALSTIGDAYLEEKKRIAASALRERDEAAASYRDLYENAPSMYLSVDAQTGRVLGCNATLLERTGRAEEDVVGADLLDLYHPDSRDRVHELFEQWRVTGEAQGARLRVLRADGSTLTILLDVSAIRNAAGTIEASRSVWTDISALVEAERALEKHARELERSNRELDDFAYIASHDLRAPLRDLDNLSQWIADDLGDDLPEETARNIPLLQGRVRRMEKLLDDLLEYSRAGRSASAPQRCSIVEIVEEVAALAPLGDAFVVRAPQKDVVVNTPRSPLVTVVRNLVVNAIKHHDRSEGRVEIDAEVHGEHVLIVVRDDGPGIPEKLHERAFKMFQTIRPRDEVEGTGLGLALVRKIADLHGGSARIRPGEGRGCSVEVRWPLRCGE